jgi:hypothetical protein
MKNREEGNRMKRGLVLLLILGMFLCFSGAARASLTTIGTAAYQGNTYNLIFEGNLGSQGLVWLDYSHYADEWQHQLNWASTLGNTLTVNLDSTYRSTIDWSTGWRLPSAGSNPQRGYNQSGSEMGHLYYDSLDNMPYLGVPQPGGGGFQNRLPFEQLSAGDYWTGTQFSSDYAWLFRFYYGYQDYLYSGVGQYYQAVAVHPGTVSAVPIPPAVWLLGSGLLGLVGLRRRFKR